MTSPGSCGAASTGYGVILAEVAKNGMSVVVEVACVGSAENAVNLTDGTAPQE